MTAREQAIAHIQAVRDSWYPTPIPAGVELDAIPCELLHRVADERHLTDHHTWITPTSDMWQDDDEVNQP